MARVIRDPNHPDFPHGTAKGRQRGCPCTPCKDARRRQLKGNHLNRLSGHDARDPALAGKAREHVRDLLDGNPYLSPVSIAAAIGRPKSDNAIRFLLDRPEYCTTTRTSRALLALTAKHAAQFAEWVTVGAIVEEARALQALGYPLAWQQQQTGIDLARYLARPADVRARARTLRLLRGLAATIHEVAAQPGENLTDEQITAARADAAAHGVYPPMCYDDAGNLIPRSIPGHRWANNDDTCDRRLRVAAALMRGASHPDAAAAGGTARRHVDRISIEVKNLLGEYDDLPPTQAKERRDALETHLWRWERGDVPSTLTALRIGMISPRALCSDHPDLARWRAETETPQAALFALPTAA